MVHRLLANRLTSMGERVDVFAYNSGGWENVFGSYPRNQIVFGGEMTLTELLSRVDYDIVHTASDTPDRGLARSLALSRCTAAVVVTCHGGELPVASLGFADALAAVSHAVADSVRERVSVPIRVIYNGIDESVFSPGARAASKRPRVLWVGRPYDERKDWPGMVALATTLAEDDVEICIAAACGSDYPVTLTDWLPGRTSVARNLSQEEIAQTYRSTAASGGCTISTSLWEGLGLSAIEALACGCPVIAPRVGGLLEVLDSTNARLYDRSAGAAGVRRMVLDLVADEPARKAMVDAGLKTVASRFTATRMARDYHSLYTELLSGSACRRPDMITRATRRATAAMCRLKAHVSR